MQYMMKYVDYMKHNRHTIAKQQNFLKQKEKLHPCIVFIYV